MPALLLALAIAAPAAPAPPPRPAPPPVARAELAGRYSGEWCGRPVSFTLTADGHYAGWYNGEFWYGTYAVRAGVVCVREWKGADPAFGVRWWFRPSRRPKGGLRRHGYACEAGAPPGETAD